MKTVQAIIVAGNAKMDQMVHAFDVFEPWKVFASVEAIEMELKDELPIEDAMEALRGVYAKAGFRVVSVFIPGDSTGAYLDQSVRAISDGNKWSMLDPVLRRYSFVKESETVRTEN